MLSILKNRIISYLKVFLILPPNIRRAALVALDLFCLYISISLSFLFTTTRLQETFYSYTVKYIWIFPVALVFALGIYIFLGQYKGLTRFVGSLDAYSILFRNFILILSIYIFGLISNLV